MRTCLNCGKFYPDTRSEAGCNMCPPCRDARDLGRSRGNELVISVAGTIRGLLRALPDSAGDECWEWCWNELDDLAQGFVREKRAKGEAALKALEITALELSVAPKITYEAMEEGLKTILSHAGSAIECVDEPGKTYLREICEIIDHIYGEDTSKEEGTP